MGGGGGGEVRDQKKKKNKKNITEIRLDAGVRKASAVRCCCCCGSMMQMECHQRIMDFQKTKTDTGCER